MITLKHLAILMVLDLVAGELLSQEPQTDTIALPVFEIKESLIQPKLQSPVPMYMVGEKLITRMPVSSLADVLKTFPGILIRDYGGIGGLKTIQVRGLGGPHTGLIVDGLPVHNLQTGQNDLSLYPSRIINSLSLHSGTTNESCQPASFYSNASMLQVNTFPVEFDSTSIGIKPTLTFGSFGLVNPVLTVIDRHGNVIYGFNGSYTHAHGRYPFKVTGTGLADTFFFRENSAVRTLTINGRVMTKTARNRNISSGFYYNNSHRELPGAFIVHNPVSRQHLLNRDFYLDFQFSSEKLKMPGFRTQASFIRQRMVYNDPGYLGSPEGLKDSYLQYEYFISQAFSAKPLKNTLLSLAQDVMLHTLESNRLADGNAARLTSLSAIILRWEKKRLLLQSGIVYLVARERVKPGSSPFITHRPSPSFSMSYMIAGKPAINLRTSFQDVFRMPTFNDLYYTQVGNTGLLPEKARQFNAGVSVGWRINNFLALDFKADGFYNRVYDKIVALPTQNLYVWSMRNLGKVIIKGAECQSVLSYQFTGNTIATVSMAYSFQQALDVTDASSPVYRHQIPYTPYETISANAGIETGDISLRYYALFNGFRYALGENIYENMLPGWWIHDIAAVYSLKLWKTRTHVKLSVNNLTNRQYEVIRNFPMPGRSVSFSLSFEF